MVPVLKVVPVFGRENRQNWNGSRWFHREEYTCDMRNAPVPPKRRNHLVPRFPLSRAKKRLPAPSALSFYSHPAAAGRRSLSRHHLLLLLPLVSDFSEPASSSTPFHPDRCAPAQRGTAASFLGLDFQDRRTRTGKWAASCCAGTACSGRSTTAERC